MSILARSSFPAIPIVNDDNEVVGLLTEKDCQECLDRIFGGKVKVEPKMLEPCRHRDMLERILRNLKAVYIRDEDARRALRVVDLLV